MELETAISKQSLHSSLICHICGDVARGMNFDVITCMPCKTFFQRHSLRSANTLYCLLNNDCNITKQTRGECSACRLKKCFLLGMNPDLIRSPYKKPIQQKKKNKLSKPKPISLLNNDRSKLTLDEWNLLSNIIHAYDEQNLIARTQYCFKIQSSLPPKIRSKQINTLQLIGSYYTAIQPFIERSPYFYTSSTDIRRIIIQNNLNGTGSFNSVLVAADANVFDNEFHVATCNEIYGTDYVRESHRFLTRLESDRSLLKILLMILAFSTNCSIVKYDHSINLINISTVNSFNLLHIQNIFVTMLWKYLVYQYGYVPAIRCFDHLVKNYLDVLILTHKNVSKQHWKMVDSIVEKTTYLLASDE